MRYTLSPVSNVSYCAPLPQRLRSHQLWATADGKIVSKRTLPQTVDLAVSARLWGGARIIGNDILDRKQPLVSEQPLVSVIIPAYNHERFVERAICSVFDQTYHSIELVVVDDGSSDTTLAAIERIRREGGYNFQLIAKSNGGVASALNTGVAASRGEFLAILASDDWFLPEKVARQVAMFSASGETMGMAHTNGLEQREDGSDAVNLRGSYQPAQGYCFTDLVARRVTAIASSVMVRRKVFDAVGGFDEKMVGEDLDFYAAVAADGHAIGFDPTPLIVKSARGDSLGSKVELFFDDPFKTLEKYRSRFSPAEYRSVEDGFYGGMGRAAAGVGKIGTSWRAYTTLGRRQRSAAPLVKFAVWNARHLALSAIPLSLRSKLRYLRAHRRSHAAP